MTTIAEPAASPAPAAPVSNKRPLETKPDGANTGEQKTKQRSVLGGLQGKQLSKMEKLHLADLKAKEAKAKKAKAENGEAGQAADTPKAKPVQRPLSKLDRELAAEKARAEAKQKAAERERKKEERAQKAALPKKPQSGYMLYSNSARAAVQEANPEAEAKEVLKLLAQAWKELSEEEQLKWKGEAEADKARYFAECKEAGVEPELKEGKDEADKHPKKPKGVFFCYAMAQRASVQEANPDSSPREVTKLLGEAWKELSEEDKKPWEAAAEAEKARYLNECKEAGVEPELKEAAPKKEKAAKKKEREEGEEAAEEAAEEEGAAKPAKKKAKAEKAAPTAEEKAAKAEKAAAAKAEKAAAKKAAADENEAEEAAEAAAEAPKIKKALSAYFLFCNDERSKLVAANPEKPGKEITAMLGAAWKALGQEEQAKWNAAAAKDKERYAAECEAAGVAPGGAKSKAEKGSAPAKAGAADKAREEELKAQIESAKAEIAEHDARSAAMKQPKSHRTALMCYKKKQIPIVAGANPDMAVEQIQELMTDTFENLSDAEKRPYDEEAQADLLRYQTACEEHKAKKDAVLKLKADTKRKLDRLEKELKDERARAKEARAAAAAANKAAKEEKAASKKAKDAEKAAKAEKAAAKKAAKEAKAAKKAAAEGSEEAAEDVEVEEASGEAADVEAAIEEAVSEEVAEEGSDAEIEEDEEEK